MRRRLADKTYDQEIQRMAALAGFPLLPRGQQDLRRAMRRISEHDRIFLHRLISEFVDGSERCPTPRELEEKAGELRRQGAAGARADCPHCHGTGYVRSTRTVRPLGMEPYEADYSVRCVCAPKGEV